jgi:hypothetical protein
MCREFLELLQMEETFDLVWVVIGDESWLDLNFSDTHLWSVSDDGCPVRVDWMIANEKQMLIVLSSRKGPLVIEWLGPGDELTTTYFCNVIIAKLVQALYPGGTVPRRRNFSFAFGQHSPSQFCRTTEFIGGKHSSDYSIDYIRRM